MKILCSICARGGSKGIKNKNIRLINGKPLIAHSIIQAIESRIFDQVVVSSDSTEILEIAANYGASYCIKRDDSLATDNAAKLPVIQDALKKSENKFVTKFDIVVDLDATSPLRSIDDIKSAVKMFVDNNYDNLITAMPSRRSPYFNLIEFDTLTGKIGTAKSLKGQIVRRQDAPQTYDMNASIYIWKHDILLNNDSVFLDKTGLYVMPEERSIDIDSELDFKFVEFMMTRVL